MGARLQERSIWAATKAVYSSLIARSRAWEIAETFFNSLTRRVFATDGVDQAIEFVDTDFDAPPTTASINVDRLIVVEPARPVLCTRPLTDAFAGNCWDDLRGTRIWLRRRSKQRGGERFPAPNWRLFPVFSIADAAPISWDAFCVKDRRHLPIALCLRHENERGITLDAALHGDVDLAILFSFTRSYFRVQSNVPIGLCVIFGN